MANRMIAEVFAMVFEFLAERPDERADVLAKRLWSRRIHFDFVPPQMHCDDALVTLGLASRTAHGRVLYCGERIILADDETGL